MTLKELKEEKRRIEAEIKRLENERVYGRAAFRRVNNYKYVSPAYVITYLEDLDELMTEARAEHEQMIKEMPMLSNEKFTWKEHAYPIARGKTKEMCIHKCEKAINDLTGLLEMLKKEE